MNELEATLYLMGAMLVTFAFVSYISYLKMKEYHRTIREVSVKDRTEFNLRDTTEDITEDKTGKLEDPEDVE